MHKNIVYCKDCKYSTCWRDGKITEKYGKGMECSLNILFCPKDLDFCSRGEKRRKGQQMRLIDADALLKRIDEERKYLKARGQLGAEHILVHNFRDLIDNAPTVAPICPYLSDDEVKQPCLQAPCERPMFNRAELEKALDYWYNNQEVGNEEQNEMAWCAINAIKYCIEHSSDYQE